MFFIKNIRRRLFTINALKLCRYTNTKRGSRKKNRNTTRLIASAFNWPVSLFIIHKQENLFCQLNKSWAEIFAHWRICFFVFFCENLSRCIIFGNGNLCKSIEDFMSNDRTFDSKDEQQSQQKIKWGIQCMRTICESNLSMTKRDQHHMNERMNSTTSMKWSVLVIHDSWRQQYQLLATNFVFKAQNTHNRNININIPSFYFFLLPLTTCLFRFQVIQSIVCVCVCANAKIHFNLTKC